MRKEMDDFFVENKRSLIIGAVQTAGIMCCVINVQEGREVCFHVTRHRTQRSAPLLNGSVELAGHSRQGMPGWRTLGYHAALE